MRPQEKGNDDMSSELQLLTTREFNGHKLDCYVELEQEDKGAFWATREQIGRLLEYKNPRKAIKIIHLRNQERLNRFSRGVQIESPQGGTQTTTVYNFKGLLEICRYSNQPIADAVIDKLWDIADEIRRTGMYLTDRTLETLKRDPEAFKQLLERYADERAENRRLREQIDSERAFTTLGRVVLALPGSMTFKDAADLLAEHGIPIGQNRLYRKCREKKLLCSRKGRQWNKPCKTALDKGLFCTELSGGFNVITVVTPKGLSYLTEMLAEENYPLLMLIEQAEDD